MPLRHLTQDDLRETLKRAAEIAQSQSPLAEPTAEEELEMYLRAAEEAGLPRAATLQALRERNLAPVVDPVVGASVFAPSADRSLYVAEIVRVDGPTATVRFAGGGEHTVALSDLRPFSLVPGLKVQCLWKYDLGMGEGWEAADVVRFDQKSGKVQVTSAWLGTREFSMKKVRIAPPVTETQARVRNLVWRAALLAGAAGTGLGLWLGWRFF